MRRRVSILHRLFAIWLGPAIALAAVGCQQQRQRLNAPPQGDAAHHAESAAYYAYHDDQGMLADMSIADIHFVPQTAELSGTGLARLERYAELLAATGGTIHYDTASRDQALIETRLATAKAFLKEAVPSARPIEVVVGLPGGRGMTAKESSAAKGVAEQPEKRERAYKLNIPTQGSSGG